MPELCLKAQGIQPVGGDSKHLLTPLANREGPADKAAQACTNSRVHEVTVAGLPQNQALSPGMLQHRGGIESLVPLVVAGLGQGLQK